MKKQEIKNLIVVQVCINKKTSNLYSGCNLTMRTPSKEECDIIKQTIYQTRNYDRNHLKMVEIHYENGYFAEETLVGFRVLGNGRYMLEQVSPIKDYNWMMVVAKKEAFVELLINERKTYGRMYTSFNGSLKYEFKEQTYEGNLDYDGEYTSTCKACGAVYQTQFVKIYKCPLCGYSKNNNIEGGE